MEQKANGMTNNLFSPVLQNMHKGAANSQSRGTPVKQQPMMQQFNTDFASTGQQTAQGTMKISSATRSKPTKIVNTRTSATKKDMQ